MGPVIILHTLEVYFIFDICHPSDYPFKPPKVYFSLIYNLDITDNGSIDVDSLRDQ
ncbi:hypothetical protein RhiirC2_835089 [Rhizophagus irregularis]|uniref:UBC core domain-containing protein n=2 Tax=Rhizophagus irregularis TaxID=588596 RepID=A0A2N1N1D1_9GLOM|nr:hypothetical protein RhiirC2_835089 [Rhizophagus irregularis]